MAYSVIAMKGFGEEADRLDKRMRERLDKALIWLKENAHHCGRMHGYQNRYKKRIGKFRLIFEIEGQTVYLICIDKRDVVYRNN